MLEAAEERSLLEEAAKGGESAFNRLWEAYEKALQGFLRTRIFSKTPFSSGAEQEEVHDITQDVFVEVRKRISIYDPEKGRFYTFLRYWANIVMMRHFRSRGKRLENVMLLYEFPELETDEIAQSFVEKLPDFEPGSLDILVELNMYRTLLEITFREGGYPHQLISFGFNRLLADWNPRSIVDKLSPRRLKKLGSKLQSEYAADSRLEEHEIRKCFGPLKSALGRKASEVLLDNATRETLFKRDERYQEQKVDETRLEDYFTADPSANISDWTYKVKEKVRRHIDSADSL